MPHDTTNKTILPEVKLTQEDKLQLAYDEAQAAVADALDQTSNALFLPQLDTLLQGYGQAVKMTPTDKDWVLFETADLNAFSKFLVTASKGQFEIDNKRLCAIRDIMPDSMKQLFGKSMPIQPDSILNGQIMPPAMSLQDAAILNYNWVRNLTELNTFLADKTALNQTMLTQEIFDHAFDFHTAGIIFRAPSNSNKSNKVLNQRLITEQEPLKQFLTSVTAVVDEKTAPVAKAFLTDLGTVKQGLFVSRSHLENLFGSQRKAIPDAKATYLGSDNTHHLVEVNVESRSNTGKRTLTVVALDRSGSMLGARIENAKTSVKKHIANITGTNADNATAVIAFDHNIQIPVPTTLINNKEDLATKVDAKITGIMTDEGGTATGAAFLAAINLIIGYCKENGPIETTIDFITDGDYSDDLPACIAQGKKLMQDAKYPMPRINVLAIQVDPRSTKATKGFIDLINSCDRIDRRGKLHQIMDSSEAAINGALEAMRGEETTNTSHIFTQLNVVVPQSSVEQKTATKSVHSYDLPKQLHTAPLLRYVQIPISDCPVLPTELSVQLHYTDLADQKRPEKQIVAKLATDGTLKALSAKHQVTMELREATERLQYMQITEKKNSTLELAKPGIVALAREFKAKNKLYALAYCNSLLDPQDCISVLSDTAVAAREKRQQQWVTDALKLCGIDPTKLTLDHIGPLVHLQQAAAAQFHGETAVALLEKLIASITQAIAKEEKVIQVATQGSFEARARATLASENKVKERYVSSAGKARSKAQQAEADATPFLELVKKGLFAENPATQTRDEKLAGILVDYEKLPADKYRTSHLQYDYGLKRLPLMIDAIKEARAKTKKSCADLENFTRDYQSALDKAATDWDGSLAAIRKIVLEVWLLFKTESDYAVKIATKPVEESQASLAKKFCFSSVLKGLAVTPAASAAPVAAAASSMAQTTFFETKATIATVAAATVTTKQLNKLLMVKGVNPKNLPKELALTIELNKTIKGTTVGEIPVGELELSQYETLCKLLINAESVKVLDKDSSRADKVLAAFVAERQKAYPMVQAAAVTQVASLTA